MLPHLKLNCGGAGGQPVMPGDGGPPVPADALLGRLREAAVLGREALLEAAPRMLRVLAAAAAAHGGVNLGLLRKFPLPVPLAAPAALGRMAASSLGEEVCELLQEARCCSWLQQQKQQLHAA